jgi:hypothetical protein
MAASRFGHRDDAIGPEDAAHLAQQPLLIGDVVERVVEHDAIDRRIGDGERLPVVRQEHRIERPVRPRIPLEQRAADGERRWRDIDGMSPGERRSPCRSTPRSMSRRDNDSGCENGLASRCSGFP